MQTFEGAAGESTRLVLDGTKPRSGRAGYFEAALGVWVRPAHDCALAFTPPPRGSVGCTPRCSRGQQIGSFLPLCSADRLLS